MKLVLKTRVSYVCVIYNVGVKYISDSENMVNIGKLSLIWLSK